MARPKVPTRVTCTYHYEDPDGQEIVIAKLVWCGVMPQNTAALHAHLGRFRLAIETLPESAWPMIWKRGPHP